MDILEVTEKNNETANYYNSEKLLMVTITVMIISSLEIVIHYKDCFKI